LQAKLAAKVVGDGQLPARPGANTNPSAVPRSPVSKSALLVSLAQVMIL
jgi:hypothetical protein